MMSRKNDACRLRIRQTLICLALCLVLPLQAQTSGNGYPPLPEGVAWGWQGETLFDLNSAALRPESLAVLERIADIMRYRPEIKLLLTGHTDNRGDLAYNQKLSVKRTEAVARYLTEREVPADRIHKRAVGEQRPVADNLCEPDRERNRRVDLAFYPVGYDPPQFGEMLHGDTRPDAAEEQENCP